MWGRACPLLIGVLVVGLVLTRRRRLGEAEAELDRVRAQASAASKRATAVASAQPQATGRGATATGGETDEDATGASDISSEWEQAVPPMDSLVGSVTQRLLHLAPCPVVAVPNRSHNGKV